MNDSNSPPSGRNKSLWEFYEQYRGDSIINDTKWLVRYSTSEIVDAVDDIALGEIARRVVRGAARLAWIDKRQPFYSFDRIVPDELEQKLDRDFRRDYCYFQEVRLQRAKIEHIESLAGRKTVLAFPKTERLAKPGLKKGNTA